MCCSVVQRAAVWCSVVQCGVVCSRCSALQCSAVILFFIMIIYYIIEEVVHVLQCGAAWYSVVQYGAVWCSALQRDAVRCSVVQLFQSLSFLCHLFVISLSFLCHLFVVYISSTYMGWLHVVGSLKLQVSFAEYRLFYRALLQKRPTILRSLLIVATP